MKILHTSDWHIGQRLHGNERYDEHELFFDWLLQTIDSEQVDVLLVCGDIFDVGYPSNRALKTYYRMLTRLAAGRCRHVIITGGNHDFAGTLEAPKEVLKFLDVTVIGGMPEDISEEIIEIRNSSDQLQAVVCAVPFLREHSIRETVAGESYDDRIEAIREGIIRHYENLATFCRQYIDRGIPLIATGHLFMQGAQVSESERDIHIGNQASVNAARMPGSFGYIALGHLHRAQKINDNPPVVYSGSPLPLSFSEQNDHKSVVLINIDGEKIERQRLSVPRFREIRSFTGTLMEVMKQLEAHIPAGQLTGWYEMHVEEQDYDPLFVRQMEAFAEQFNKTQDNMQIIRQTLNFATDGKDNGAATDETTTLDDVSEMQVFGKLLDQYSISDRDELLFCFRNLCEGLDDEH